MEKIKNALPNLGFPISGFPSQDSALPRMVKTSQAWSSLTKLSGSAQYFQRFSLPVIPRNSEVLREVETAALSPVYPTQSHSIPLNPTQSHSIPLNPTVETFPPLQKPAKIIISIATLPITNHQSPFTNHPIPSASSETITGFNRLIFQLPRSFMKKAPSLPNFLNLKS